MPSGRRRRLRQPHSAVRAGVGVACRCRLRQLSRRLHPRLRVCAGLADHHATLLRGRSACSPGRRCWRKSPDRAGRNPRRRPVQRPGRRGLWLQCLRSGTSVAMSSLLRRFRRYEPPAPGALRALASEGLLAGRSRRRRPPAAYRPARTVAPGVAPGSLRSRRRDERTSVPVPPVAAAARRSGRGRAGLMSPRLRFFGVLGHARDRAGSAGGGHKPW